MTTEQKKALLVFAGGLLLFWAFKKIKPVGSFKSKKSSSSAKIKIPTEEEKKNAAILISAYGSAQKAGEPKSFLDNMNVEFAKEFKMKVYTDKGSGRIFVADLEGNKIL